MSFPANSDGSSWNSAQTAAFMASLSGQMGNLGQNSGGDLVDLYNNGNQVPLSLLTPGAILLFHRGERPKFSFPLDSAANRQLDGYLKLDRHYLRFLDWATAAAIYAVLINHVSPPQSDPLIGTHSDSQTWLEHDISVQSLHHGDNWAVLREYDYRVREAMAASMRDGVDMEFDIRSVDRKLLDLSAEMVRFKGRSFLDTDGALESEIARIVKAPASEYETIVKVGLSTSSASGNQASPKRKVARLPSALGGAKTPGPSSGGDSFRGQGIRWCPICCQHTDKHSWVSCHEPAAGPDKLINIQATKCWHWHTTRQAVCINYNCNLACGTKKPTGTGDAPTPSCPFGYYCTRFGGSHRSIQGVCTAFAAAGAVSASGSDKAKLSV
ncbi:hypothetical protein A4X06_0g5428 [Tilletia controversa]|uniref:Uncharacterized protein n=1 Tax=Tilletia controversa TaxID=13291 RepID=A0A8X7SW55_9BASI|nr:hypothetical protein CF328_g8502 [Tilletia controversa]KAE8245775.1 hypothetical protein A4X06_0g5428 [Tilletia controversa]